MKKIYNFSAGPACLPEQALAASNKAIKNFKGSGVSLLELSHRSNLVVDLFQDTTKTCEGATEPYYDQQNSNTFISQKELDNFGKEIKENLSGVENCGGKNAVETTKHIKPIETKVIWVDPTANNNTDDIQRSIKTTNNGDFELYAVIYGGHLTESSHYIALIQTRDKGWYRHDDSTVEKYNEIATTVPGVLKGLNKRYLFYISSDDIPLLPEENSIGFGQKGNSCWFASILKVLLNLPYFIGAVLDSLEDGPRLLFE